MFLHRPFSQVVIDSEDCFIVEDTEQSDIEGVRRGEIVTERFFNDDAGALGTVSFGQLGDDCGE